MYLPVAGTLASVWISRLAVRAVSKFSAPLSASRAPSSRPDRPILVRTSAAAPLLLPHPCSARPPQRHEQTPRADDTARVLARHSSNTRAYGRTGPWITTHSNRRGRGVADETLSFPHTHRSTTMWNPRRQKSSTRACWRCFYSRIMLSSDVTLLIRGLLSFFLMLLLQSGVARGNLDSKRLYDDVMRRSGYNRIVRPVRNESHRIMVTVGLKLSQLIDVVSNKPPQWWSSVS